MAIIRTRLRIAATARMEIRLGSTTRLWLRVRLKLGTILERMSTLSLLIRLLLILGWEL